MFTVKVPEGNDEGKNLVIHKARPYLEILPKNPPIPTNSNVLFMLLQFFKI